MYIFYAKCEKIMKTKIRRPKSEKTIVTIFYDVFYTVFVYVHSIFTYDRML